MKDLIEILLQKKAELEAEKVAEKELACKEIDEKFADRANRIDKCLTECGYVEPVDEVVNEVVDEASEMVDEVVNEVVDEKEEVAGVQSVDAPKCIVY